MSFYKLIAILISFSCSVLSATEFTVCSYNCGGLSDHYDYLRAASMQKVMQDRYNAEPEKMALNERIQQVAIKILFASDVQEKALAQQEWDQKGYQRILEQLTTSNALWFQKSEEAITSYRVRPVSIFDVEIQQMLNEHFKDLCVDGTDIVTEARATMAKRIFAHHLKYDIICLQEATYLDATMFPAHYEVLFAEESHSINGIAWNKERFDLVEVIGDILGNAFVVQLRDKESGKTVLVASGHITGCNPYREEKDLTTGVADSAKGDSELQAVIDLFDDRQADFMVIAMDSNVTSVHPRLKLLKEAGYKVDSDNFMEQTCTNPNMMLNTRIDWIGVKSSKGEAAFIRNIPVLGVGLNSIQTNISDHKPIAAKVNF